MTNLRKRNLSVSLNREQEILNNICVSLTNKFNKPISYSEALRLIINFCNENYSCFETTVSKIPLDLPGRGFVLEEGSEEYVYVMEDGTGNTKIGFSKFYPVNRLKELQTGNSTLKLMGYIKNLNAKKIEKYFHTKFSPFHIKNEWFEIRYEDIKKNSEYVFVDV